MNKFSYKILFYILLFFLLIKNIYYINIEKFENILIFFITYILSCFLIDNNIIKILLCIIIPDILYFQPIIEGANDISNMRNHIKDKGEKNLEKQNEEEEKKNDKLSEEENEDNVDKKGFETNGDDGSEEELENLVN